MLPQVVRVQRNGDFQTIYFSDGSQLYGGTEQDPDTGEYIDCRAVEHVLHAFGRTDLMLPNQPEVPC